MASNSSNFTKVTQKSPPKNTSPYLIERSVVSDTKLNNEQKGQVSSSLREDGPESGIGREEFKDIRDFLKNRKIRKKATQIKEEPFTCSNESTEDVTTTASADKSVIFPAKNIRQSGHSNTPSKVNQKYSETLPTSKRSRKELLEALRKKNQQKTDLDSSPKNMIEPAFLSNEKMDLANVDGSTESDSSLSNRSPRSTDPFVIVHQDPSSRRCKPITELRELPELHYEYVRHLSNSLDYKKPKHEMEKSLWPIIYKSNSAVIISGKLKNRYGSYLIPLINQILVGESYSKQSHAPLAVILCPDWIIAKQVCNFAIDLGSKVHLDNEHTAAREDKSYQGFKVNNDSLPFHPVVMYCNEKLYASKLANGCHLLITTPKSLSRMLNPLANLVNLNRCCHIIFEEAHECFDKFPQEVNHIVNNFIQLRNEAPSQPAQIIVSSQEWNRAIETFVKTFMIRDDVVGPFLVFENPLEALIYSQIDIKTQVFETQEEKLHGLQKILEQPSDHLDVIFCKDAHSSSKISKFLIGCGFEVAELKRYMNQLEINRVIAECRQRSRSILILPDKSTILRPLLLSTKDRILHFDYGRKSSFADRFLHMKKSIKSLYETKNKDVIPNCHLLIDPDDHEACLTLVLLLRKCGSMIPKRLAEIIKSRTTGIENTPLCQKIKLLGYCNPLKSKCHLRHHFVNFSSQNKNTMVPPSGFIEFLVTWNFEANHHLVKIHCIKNDVQEEVISHNHFNRMHMKLVRLNNLKSLAKAENLELGNVYAVKDKVDQVTKRGQIKEFIVKEDERKVKILFVDEGKMYVPYAANVEFCDLPEEFNLQNIPMLSSEIVLLNMVPMDQFPKWPLEAEDRMCSMFRLDSNQIKRGNYKFRAEFVLNVENIFFVRRIQKMKKMVSEDQPLDWTAIADVRDKLKVFSNDFELHGSRLLDLCKKSKLKPLTYSALERQVQSLKEKSLDEYLNNDHSNISMLQKQNAFKRQEISSSPRYAFFDKFQDNQESIVRITEILSPSHFYVNIFKFEEQLRRLELDLEKEYKGNLKSSSTECKYILGQIYICKWNEDNYHRVQLINEQEIFFVDYGSTDFIPDTKLVPISKQTHDRLPFQAIKCSLKYLKPKKDEDDWSMEACYAFEENLNGLFSVLIPCIRKTNDYYEIDLTNEETFENVAVKLFKDGFCHYEGNIIEAEDFLLPSSDIEKLQGKDIQEEISSSFNFKKTKKKKKITIQQQNIPLPITKHHLPKDLPSLALPEFKIDNRKRPNEVTWGQPSQLELTVTVKIFGVDIHPNHSWIHVTTDQVNFSYLHVTQDSTGNDLYSLFEIPAIIFFSEIMPQETKVKFHPQTIEICLKKAKPMFWPKPCIDPDTKEPIKHSWMKNAQICYDSDDDYENDVSKDINATPPIVSNYGEVKDISDSENNESNNSEVSSEELKESDDDFFL